MNLQKKSTFLSQLGFITETKSNERIIRILKRLINILDCNKRLGCLRSIGMLKDFVSTEMKNENDSFLFKSFSPFLDLDKTISSSFSKLCEILKENLLEKDHDESRVLIFVKERFSAKWLAEQLAQNEIFSKFVPRLSK